MTEVRYLIWFFEVGYLISKRIEYFINIPSVRSLILSLNEIVKTVKQ